jgi:hypothetical protein
MKCLTESNELIAAGPSAGRCFVSFLAPLKLDGIDRALLFRATEDVKRYYRPTVDMAIVLGYSDAEGVGARAEHLGSFLAPASNRHLGRSGRLSLKNASQFESHAAVTVVDPRHSVARAWVGPAGRPSLVGPELDRRGT